MNVLFDAGRILLPVVALLAAGYLAGSVRFGADRRRLDLGWPSWVALHVFATALVFSGLFNARIELGGVAGLFGVIFTFLMLLGLLALAVLRAQRLPPQLTHPYLLVVLFGNSGYYGLPVCLSAFGREGLALGILYMVCTSVLSNTLGLYLAARGKAQAREALAETVRSPILWSLVLSIGVRAAGITRPAWLFASIDLLAAGAIPVTLLLLGAQLAQMSLPPRLPALASASVLRLVAAPLLAALVTAAAGVSGLQRQVILVESAMPTAVVAGLFAMHFDAEPEFVSGAVLLSTLISPLTLLVVLALVR